MAKKEMVVWCQVGIRGEEIQCGRSGGIVPIQRSRDVEDVPDE